MSFADAIAVNSKFTRGVVGRTWPALARGRELKVVYPCIDTRPQKEDNDQAVGTGWKYGEVILSINRFERKKDVALAIKAFAGLRKEQRKGVKLVVAGKELFNLLPVLALCNLLTSDFRRLRLSCPRKRRLP